MTQYAGQFPREYALLRTATVPRLWLDGVALDVGAGEGILVGMAEQAAVPMTIHCVDTDAKALAGIPRPVGTEVITYNEDANLFLRNLHLEVDLIFLSSSLHEISSPGDSGRYLERFFAQAYRLLRPGGEIVLGDFYYPSYASPESIEAYRQSLLAEIGHADLPERFIHWETVEEYARKGGLEITFGQAMASGPRKYYVCAFRKPE